MDDFFVIPVLKVESVVAVARQVHLLPGQSRDVRVRRVYDFGFRHGVCCGSDRFLRSHFLLYVDWGLDQ